MDSFVETISKLIKPSHEICKECNFICNAIHFQQNFENWTSGNDNIDKFIQVTQQSAHGNNYYVIFEKVLEWIPYDRFYDIKYIAKREVYKANWIDGNIIYWDYEKQNWERNNNMIVTLKGLDNPKVITLEFMNEIKIDHEFYGITQNPETRNYMIVLNDKCKKCNYICNAIHFQQNFENWTSDNSDIDKFIQDTQLSTHGNYKVFENALEWISYDRFNNITKSSNTNRANWIDGNISYWDYGKRNWKRNNNMIVSLKELNNPKIISYEFMNEIRIDYEFYGITQNPETNNYMMVLNYKGKKCFQQNFGNWTSGNDDIDKFVQDTQLSAHKNVKKALEWIPYNRFINVEKIGRFGKVYRANWIDGYICEWDSKDQNWKRNNNMIVTFKELDNLKNITLERIGGLCGITQNPETKNYMMVLNDLCKICKDTCNAIRFQQNFENWASDNDDIDKFIQDTQLSAHENVKAALEWIPYDRFYDIKYIANKKVYKANWIDGCISYWDYVNQDWERNNNIIVTLKELNNPKIISLEFMNEISKPYGITQNPETKNYMMVLSDKCNKCKDTCITIHFQQNFENWTSGNDDIDKFIQDTQLSTHVEYRVFENALEWIPYDRFNNIEKNRFDKTYGAYWIDGRINCWNYKRQNWERNNNMIVSLIELDSPEVITLEFMNETKIDHEFYGITQDPVTKNYMMVLNYRCFKKCNYICNAIHFQRNFENWTSDNSDIDKFIQDTQLSTHGNYKVFEDALEWIPYDRFNNIEKSRFGKTYGAYWIDGNISCWDYKRRNWERNNNMIVSLIGLDSPEVITLKFMNEIKRDHIFYGITRNPETKNYMMVLNDKCRICDYMCNTIHFQRNFENWTSGNDDIDKLIRDTQLLIHDDDNDVFKKVLEWIPYDRFYDIKYIAKGGFGKVYRASWIDGYIISWKDNCWNRYNKNMFVALKSLDNSKNVTLEFMNEITLHNKGKMNNAFIIGFYGITQDPETKNYMMVLDYAEDGSLRNYLDKEYNKLKWNRKIDYIYDIIIGLERIHEKELIHRDLHIGNILKLKYDTAITDMGLCKPANYIESKNNIYGVLPYIAPEILRGQNYTKAADIYSFGIIMYEVISGLPPYYDLSHDRNLAIKICKGLRPRFNIKVPQLIVYLIKRCLDADPLNRPIAREVKNIINKWRYEPAELQAQIKEADINNGSLTNRIPSTSLGLSYETHSEAIYTSRLLDFNNLPEPKNSDDYYEQNDNIISMKFSESLQIDISQLNINLRD